MKKQRLLERQEKAAEKERLKASKQLEKLALRAAKPGESIKVISFVFYFLILITYLKSQLRTR